MILDVESDSEIYFQEIVWVCYTDLHLLLTYPFFHIVYSSYPYLIICLSLHMCFLIASLRRPFKKSVWLKDALLKSRPA